MPSFSLKQAAALLATLVLCAVSGAAHAMGGSDYDDKAAVIFTYLAIGDDADPSASLTRDQFMDQVRELTEESYNVEALPAVVDAFIAGKSLPARTVALTFDGADKSVLEIAAPYLIDHKMPFTVFIPAGKIGTPPYMSWDDLRDLKKSGLVSFGLHPSGYGTLADMADNDIKRQLNTSLAQIRDELHVDVSLLAYPYGEYDDAFKTIAKAMGFKAAFGQQSGVAYAGGDMFALPRFTLTERYGDLDRFRMTANALPFPVSDVSPADPHLNTLSPAIGFTVPDDMAKNLKALSCFSSSNEKPKIQILNKSRVEIRMTQPFAEDRPRINCTLPSDAKNGEDQRWRWFGMLYTLQPGVLDKAAQDAASKIQQHAGETDDSVNAD